LFVEEDKLMYVAVTIGESGSIIYGKHEIYKIPSIQPSTKIVNTLGAGDAYAAGFIYGLVRKYHPEKCGKIASIIASFALTQESALPVFLFENLRSEYKKNFSESFT
jgi:sugar/nucleoside kinase (ribokinase family)